MNIFILDKNPVLAAQMHNDVHVRKMIVESGQMMSTNYRMLNGTMEKRPSASGKTMQKHWVLDNECLEELLYKTVHINHPCTIWMRESQAHWDWHLEFFNALCDEYTYRFGKVHETDNKLREVFNNLDPNISKKEFTGFVTAMDQYPHCVVLGDVVQSYRNYYVDQKLKFTTYTKREAPEWLQPHLKSS